jgi:anti-sigma B factor antagonist
LAEKSEKIIDVKTGLPLAETETGYDWIVSSKLAYCIFEIRGHKILKVSGEIDAYSAPEFRQAVTNFIDRGVPHLLIDMYDVTYMDSSGFAVFVCALKRLSANGGTVNLIGCSPTTARILYITKLSAIIELHECIEDAIDAVYGDY